MRQHARLLRAVPLTTAAVLLSLAAADGLVDATTAATDAPLPGAPLNRALPAAALVACVSVVAIGEVHGADRPTGRLLTPDRTNAANGLAVAAAAPVTRWLAVEAGLGVVVASALVGLLAGLLVPKHAAPAYCGSFVGMAAPGVFPGYRLVTAAGLVAGLVYVAVDGVFDGVGGKLGTTAFVGCGTVAIGAGVTPGSGTMPGPTAAVLLVAVAGAAAVGTFALSVRLEYGPVVGSAVVGLAAGVAAPLLLPVGEAVAAAAFCASFAGMVSPDRLPNESATLLAGLVSGALFVAVTPAFAGFGGKLGTVAFTACLVTVGLLSAGRVVDAARRRAASS